MGRCLLIIMNNWQKRLLFQVCVFCCWMVMRSVGIFLEHVPKMTPMGFEPTPMKTTALTLRLRPLGHSVCHAYVTTHVVLQTHAWHLQIQNKTTQHQCKPGLHRIRVAQVQPNWKYIQSTKNECIMQHLLLISFLISI